MDQSTHGRVSLIEEEWARAFAPRALSGIRTNESVRVFLCKIEQLFQETITVYFLTLLDFLDLFGKPFA